MANDRSTQNMCPICTNWFAEGDMIVEYRKWSGGDGSDIYLGHLDCVLQLSVAERRNHPPLTAILKPPSKRLTEKGAE